MNVQEEFGVGKKLNTNGDKDDQSGRATGPAASTVRGSINSDLRDSMSSIQGPIIKSLDLGSTDSSWMDAAGTISDSEEDGEDMRKEVDECNWRKRGGNSCDSGESEENSFFDGVARLETTVLQYFQDGSGW